MKDLRIFLSILCLFSLYAISNTTSASGEDEGHKFGFVSIVHAVPTEYEGKVEYSRISKKKEVKKVASKIKVAPKTKKLPAPVPKTPTVPTPPKQTPITPAPTSSITKSATVTYQSPGGVDTVTFSVTANRGVITAAASTPNASNETSTWYQESFGRALAQVVVGKKISDLNLSAIGGASLTTGAFVRFISSSF